MSTKVKIACIQTNTCNNLERNLAECERMVLEAVEGGAEFIHLPENAFLMRASDRDRATIYEDVDHPGVHLCQRLAKEHGVWILIGSVFAPAVTAPEGSGDARWYNRSLLINDQGQITARYNKIHLFDAALGPDRYYQESARIKPGENIVVTDTPWGKLGMAICYDVRFPHLHREMAKAGARMISIPAAFAEHTGKAHWHVLLRARAIETGCFVIAPGQCGTHPGDKRTYGYSLIINPWGEIVAEGHPTDTCVIIAEIDVDDVDDIRKRLPSIHHDRDYFPTPDYVI